MPPPDERSTEARAWRKLYDLPQWRGPHGARQQQLRKQPLCERCLAEGRTTAATVVNHRTPHKGNLELFLDPANHESTCAEHHDSAIQSEERRGYSNAIGADGWPDDPRHPSNRAQPS